MEKNVKNTNIIYMRVGYGLFICLGIYHVLFHKDFIECSMNMGLALVFDPFDQNIPWNSRPRWQRIWLIIHLAIAAALLGYGISINGGI